MEQDTRKRALSAALVAIAAAGAFAGPAAAGGTDQAPNGQPPAHGVRGETPPAHAGKPEQAPPQHAPAHGVRGTQPRGAKSRGSTARGGSAPKQKRSKGSRPSPPPHAPAHGVRGTKPSTAKSSKPAGAKGERVKEDNGGGQPRGTLCHATGSEKNPYVEIEIANPAIVRAHDGHQHDQDIIPAPEGGCPSPVDAAARAAAGLGASGLETPAAGTAASGSPVAPTGTPASGAPAPANAVPGVVTSSATGSAGEKDRIQVLGEIESEAGTAEAAGGAPAADAAPAAEDGSSGLPFTGLSLIAVVLAGLAALLTGVALWRGTRAPRRPTA